jgi:alpha-maltose-1-phosphate synthase
VVPIRSAAAIAERFQQMADDPALQERMRAAALVKVKSFGGWHEYGLHYIDFLKQLTKTG